MEKQPISKQTYSKTYCLKKGGLTRLYKLKQRSSKIHHAEIKAEVKRKPKAFVTEDEIRAIQAKEYLTLKEAALLLNVSPLTLRRWVLGGKVKSNKVGKKHAFERKQLARN